MQIDQTLISLVSATTALIASVAGPIATLRVARQQFRASVLSVNRQRWIDALRQAVSSATSQLMIAAVIRDHGPRQSRFDFSKDPTMLKRVEDLMLTIAQIELLLRPSDPSHIEMQETLDKALVLLKEPPEGDVLEDEIGALVKVILAQAKAIVRSQWLLVKAGR